MQSEDKIKANQPITEKPATGSQIPAPKFQTDSGIPVKAAYTPADLQEIGFEPGRDLGSPGKYPFTRGRDSEGYRKNLWVMSQYSGFGDPESSNKRYQFLLSKGQTGLSIALDLPTQLGYDSDNPIAEGEVGKIGVSISSLQDIEIMFQGIPLDKPRQVSTTANAIAGIWLAMLIAQAEKQGVNPGNCNFRVQNDVLKEYVARGAYIYPPEPSVSLATDVITYATEHYPKWLPLTACGYHIREAGADAAQEIAFTLADALAYIDDVIRKGVNPEKFVSQLSVMLAVNMDFLEEIAKFRAMRRLWARTINKRYNISNPDLLSFNLINFTAGSSLTAQQPLNNIVRVAVEVLASALGTCNTLFPCSYDEAFCTPTEQAVKVALRTQQIIGNETGVTRTSDPLAGSYYIETLTTKLEQKAEEYLKKVFDLGGPVKAIEAGYMQKEISRRAYELKRSVEEKERIVVGVNEFVEKEETPIEILKVDPVLEKKQVARLKKLKQERDNTAVKRALALVKQDAQQKKNMMPSTIEAVKVYATVGEICDTLREVYGEYKAPSWR